MTDTFLRVWKPDRRGVEKHAGRSGIDRVEVVKDGEVVAEIPGLTHVQISDPIDGVSNLNLTTVHFELKIAPREEEKKSEFPMRLGKDAE